MNHSKQPFVRGVTLLELLVVIAIVGILAAMALPNFGKSIEGSRVKDTQAILAAIYSAERVYRLDQGGFGTLGNLVNNNYVSPPDANNSNADWDFGVTNDGTTTSATFLATGTRTGGGYNNNTVRVNQGFDGRCYDGNHPLRDFTGNPC